MYAIIGTGGKQYRVAKGDTVKVELLPPDTKKVTFSEVYLVGNGQDTAVGDPVVSGARVTGTVVGNGRLPKVLVFKMKRRKQYKRTIGHRQHYSAVRIEEIDSGGTVKPLEGQKAAAKTRKKKTTRAAGKKKVTRKATKKTATKKTAAGSKKTTTKKKTTVRKTATKKTSTRKTATKKTGKKKTSK